LPFTLAHILNIAARRAAVIQQTAAVTGLRGAVLPEIIAKTGTSPTVIAQQDGPRQVLRARQQWRKARGFRL
jgi:hypothetical protein